MKHAKHILLVVSVLLCSISVSAHDFEVDGIYYNITNSTELTVGVGGTSLTGNLTVPSTITYEGYTYSVTSIEEQAFQDCSSLTSITISESVTSIEKYAFDGCTSLKEVIIEDGITTLSLGYNYYSSIYYYIGEGLFCDCPLETVYLGRNLSYSSGPSYGYSPFYDKDALTNVVISNTVTSIGNNAFFGCSSLPSITIPEGVTRIGDYAFAGCSSLTSVTCCAVVPPACKSSSFSEVSTSIPLNVPENSAIVYQEADVWKEFTNVIAGAPVLSQYSVALFEGKSLSLTVTLTLVTAPDKSMVWTSSNPEVAVVDSEGNVTAIAPGTAIIAVSVNNGQGVTASCEVTVMKTPIASIEELNNDVLYHIYTPRGSWAVAEGRYEFRSNADLDINISSIDTRQQFAIVCYDGVNHYLYHVAEKKFVNKGGVLTIGAVDPVYFKAGAYESTFVIYFDESHYINIGGSYQMTIDTWNTADEGNSCTIVPVGELKLLLNIADSITYSQIAEGEAEVISGGKVSGDVEIPEIIMIGEKSCQVSSIGNDAFYGCDSLTSITIPNGVISIGDRAFYHCRVLTSITIPESVTEIGEGAFLGCWKLTSVIIPNGVNKIERESFCVCSSLTSITIPESVTEIGEEAFYGCDSLTSITCCAVVPPTCNSSSFARVDTSIPVYVAKESVAAYQTAEGWKDFLNFVGEDLTGIESCEVTNKTLSSTIYDLHGRRVSHPEKGLYIVNGRKVAIR